MSQFQLFDAVELRESLVLADGQTVPVGTAGAVVEVFEDGTTYEVELFGRWVRTRSNGDFTDSSADEPEAFRECIGVGTVRAEQLELVLSPEGTIDVRAELLTLVEELSEEALEEVRNFAKFLKYQRNRTAQMS